MDLSIISAPRPISAAFRKTLFCGAEPSVFVTVAAMTSILLGVPEENMRQHSITPAGMPSDLASTFLVPHGTIAITASGFTALRGSGAPASDFRRRLPAFVPWSSGTCTGSKKPFATSLSVPSPPIAIIVR